MKKIIIKGMRLLLAGGVTACCLIGCGSKVASETENQKAAEEKKQQEEKAVEKETAVADNVKADSTDEKTDNEREIPYTGSGIPVYGEGEKGKIKKYLSSLPDKVGSFKEMKKLGMIGGTHNRNLYSEKENNYFDEEWYKFLTITRKSEERERDRKQGKGVYDISTAIAVVMLSYTTEGDTIYDYISYIDGKYYVYTDYSRDKFGEGEFCGSYEEVAEYTNAKEGTVEYYLIREADVPKEKWEKWLDAEDGYDRKKINQIYAVENSSNVAVIFNN